jgi:hypothetical protein
MGSGVFLVGADVEDLFNRLADARDLDDSEVVATAHSRVSACTKARLQAFADVSGRPQSAQIRQFIREGLDRLEQELLDEV